MLNNDLEFLFEPCNGQRDSSDLNNNKFLSPSFFDPYAHIYGKNVFLAPHGLSFSTSQQFDTNYQSEEPMQLIQEQQHDKQESTQLIQEQQHKQESTQLVNEQESDEESDCCDENNVDIIKVSTEFPSWKSLESALKRYEVEIGFKSIKFRIEHDNNGRYFADTSKRESKKVGCLWQLNVGFRKDINSIVVNKFIEIHNHSLAPYREEFAPSLRTLSQDVLNEIKFLTQEYSLEQRPNCCNSCSEAELEHHWEELLIQYPVGKNYLIQLWKSRQSWAKIYVFTTYCARMQSTQWVKGTNGLIKKEVSAKTTLLNLVKAIQLKLEREAQYQRLSEYKNALPTRGLPSIQSLPNAHEYTEGYLEDEYDALQASLENIINMVNHENIIEIWRVSLFDQHNHNYPHYVILLTDNTHLCICLYIISNSFYCRHFFNVFKMSRNAKFDIKLISKHWYTESMQASDYSVITSTAASEFNTYEEMNQDTYEEVNHVISIHGSNTYRARIHTSIVQKQEYVHGFGIAKNGLKFALENSLVNEFIGLIVRFIGHTGVDTTERMMVDVNKIENPKKLKHKGRPKLTGPMQQSAFQDLDTRQNKSSRITETDSEDEDIEDEDGPIKKMS
ncbi:25306_t:CDS:2 [Gigaspora margarita]|uniref:25306_t:CDS:1 n=1 Tax=Gigaspora margarita TaxID=4874 RepID=A0ABN7V3Y6_GIGMA|nr:25306_t:CDS:2 [Gigaspora margarita]